MVNLAFADRSLTRFWEGSTGDSAVANFEGSRVSSGLSPKTDAESCSLVWSLGKIPTSDALYLEYRIRISAIL